MRQGGGHELWVGPQALEHRRTNLLGQGMPLGQLQVVLGLGRLMTGRDLAIGPIGLFQSLANAQHFLAGKQAGNV
ncbi:hypothetical protein D3C86_2166620 [compost metagenome]